MPEGECPFYTLPFIVEGVGRAKYSGTSWASLKAVQKACGSYWGNGCSVFPLCWADIFPALKSKHKNFELVFRPIEWVPVERFSQFAPSAAALKAACCPAQPAAPQLTASEIVGDKIDDFSPPPKQDVAPAKDPLIGKTKKPFKRPASMPTDPSDEIPGWD